MTTTRLTAILMLFGLALWGCGSDGVGNSGDVVGGSCNSWSDCEQACLMGGDFPAGTCSVACASDGDCPEGTHCIDRDGGGWCLLACELPADCRPGYSCKGKNNRGHSGESLVCIED